MSDVETRCCDEGDDGSHAGDSEGVTKAGQTSRARMIDGIGSEIIYPAIQEVEYVSTDTRSD